MKVIVAKDYTDLSRKAANMLSAQVIIKPGCVLGLATGSTSVGIYRQLIDWYEKGDIDFSQVKTVNLDEYVGMPSSDIHSYAYFMRKNFFSHINIDMKNTYIPDGTAANILDECRRYDQIIRRLGGIDMQLLGVGPNGHVGFNEPGDIFMRDTFCVRLSKETLKANSIYFDNPLEMPETALTVGLKTIMQAKKVVVAVSGKKKSKILHDMLNGPVTPQLPASILQLHSDVTVIADGEALEYIRINNPQILSSLF